MNALGRSLTVFVANGATAAAQYAIVVLIARHLGAASFGEYVTAAALGSIFATLPNFGLDRILIREVARDCHAALALTRTIVLLRSGLTLVAIPLAVLSSYGLGHTAHLVELVVVALLGLSLNLFTEACRSTLFALGDVRFEATLRYGGRALAVAAVAGGCMTGASLVAVLWLLCAASLVEAIGYAAGVANRTRALPATGPAIGAKGLMRAALPLAISTVLVVIYFRANIVLLSHHLGTEAAGMYGAAFTFLQLLQVISGAVAAVALPAMSGVSLRETRDVVVRATRYLLATIIPICILVWILAPQLIRLVYGDQYQAAQDTLRIVIWAAVCMFLGSIFGTALIALDDQRHLMSATAVAAASSICLNLVLIAKLGLSGAALATVATEALVAAMTWMLLRKRIGPLGVSRSLIRVLAAGAMAVLAAFLADSGHWGIRVIATMAVYLAAGTALGVFPRDAWRVVFRGLAGRTAKDPADV